MSNYTIYEDYLLCERDDGEFNKLYYCESLEDWNKLLPSLKKEGYKYFYEYDYTPEVLSDYFPIIVLADSEKTWGFSKIEYNRVKYESEEWFINWILSIKRRKKLTRILK